MNARKFLNVRVSLTVTALALGGALVFSAMTTSCAGSGSGGAGGAGPTGSGGSAGGAAGGGAGSSGSTSCTASADGVCFAAGQASGLLSGYGWIAMGQFDSASQPKCDSTGATPPGTASDPITKAAPCPSVGGKTVWNTPNQGLCITGSVPVVGTTAGVTGPDYTGYWGLEVGANTDTSGGTVDISGYTSVAFSYNDSAISPAPTGLIRGEIHVKGHVPTDESYCAVLKGSGQGTLLTSFNTQCWTGGAGIALTPADMKNIDQMGVQISSDTTNSYTVSNFCWSGVTFTK
jgi:hypothetical protein